MSGWALALRRDGRPIDRPLFLGMLSRLVHRGPDGQDCAFFDCLAMGHLHFRTTPEEAGERQPLCGGPSSIDLVFDGRLDNRDELVEHLGEDQQDLRLASDAELVRRAFRLWGDECFDRFEGPFALALRDRLSGRIVCARDGLGERSLSYFLSESLLLVASEESAILAHPSVDQRTDPTSIARFFAFQGPEEGRTYFAEVRELPAAHLLSVDGDRCRLRRYWELDAGARLAYRREEEYAEHFAELLRRSVGSQLRSASVPPAILLSGGLDSASVAALAGRELQQRGSGAARAVSWTFNKLHECDEREWIDPVVERSALEAVRLPCDDGWPLAGGVEAWPRSPNIPFNNPFRLLLNRGYEAVVAGGGRVVLSGWFGDNLYHGSEQWIADLLGEWRWLELSRASARAARLRGEALRNGLLPGLRYWAGTVLGGRRLRPSGRRKLESSWLTPWARDLRGQEGSGFGPKGRDLRRSRILNSFEIVAAREETAFASTVGVEHRYPYWSRPLVQFALSLPSHLLYRPGSEKHILRLAMKDLLPESVRQRQGHRVLESLFFESVANRARDAVRQLLERGDCQWLRYVDRHRMQSILARLLRGERVRGVDSAVLWQCVSFELWRSSPAAEGVHP